MAKPIKPTPPVTGEDAERLAESLSSVAAPEVMARRIAAAQSQLKAMTLPKGARGRQRALEAGKRVMAKHDAVLRRLAE